MGEATGEFSHNRPREERTQAHLETEQTKRPLEDFDLTTLQLPNESSPSHRNILVPLGAPSDMENGQRTQLQRTFDYYADTRELEIDSDRTKILNAYVQKMIAGTDVNTARVIIANRGVVPQGFVYPEGTIFINQSLINLLDTMDELVGVLAHEVNHLILKTAQTTFGRNQLDATGIGWLHEMTADLATVNLLEKAQLNSTSLASAIQKISGSQRGFIHQGGLMRGAQVAAYHHAVHTETSYLEQRPLPPDWKKQQVVPTNEEAVSEVLSRDPYASGNEQLLKNVLSQLHPSDLEKTVKNAIMHGTSRKTAITEEVGKRLKNNHATMDEEFLFQLSYVLPPTMTDQIFTTKDALLPFITSMYEDETKTRLSNLSENILYRDSWNPPGQQFLSFLSENLSTASSPEDRGTNEIPVDEDTLLASLHFLNDKVGERYVADRLLLNILVTYIHKGIIGSQQASPEETNEQIRAFLTKASAQLPNVLKDGYPELLPDLFYEHNPMRTTAIHVRDLITGESSSEVTSSKLEDKLMGILQEPEGNDKNAALEKAMRALREYFDKNKVTDEERERLLESLFQKIDTIPPYEGGFSNYKELTGEKDPLRLWNAVREYEENPDSYRFTDEEREVNQKIATCSLKLLLTNSLYQEDSSSYYDTLERIMDESGLVNVLPPAALVNLSAAVLASKGLGESRSGSFPQFYRQTSNGRLHMYNMVAPKNLSRLADLPFIKASLPAVAVPENATMQDLYRQMEQFTSVLTPFYSESYFGSSGSDVQNSLFADSPFALLYLSGFRKRFVELLYEDVDLSENSAFFSIIKNYYPDEPLKSRLLQDVAEKTLHGTQSIEEKISFLRQNYRTIGPEGLTILAEQMDSLEQYQQLRKGMGAEFQEYLTGQETINKVALADMASSEMTKHFDDLLATTLSTPQGSKEVSTAFAKKWAELAVGKGTLITGASIEFLPDEKKFFVDDAARDKFKSVNDFIETLHNLSPTQRFFMLTKALLDKDGAFSSPQSRKVLAEFVQRSLQIPDGFVSHLVDAACKSGEVNTLSPIISIALSPYLFQGLKTEAIDTTELAESDVTNYYKNRFGKLGNFLSDQDLTRMVTSSTRDIVAFGYRYRDAKDQTVRTQTEEVKNSYYEAHELLEGSLADDTKEIFATQDVIEAKDPTIEALIRGVQASGSVGVRAMQLAVQFDLGLSEDILQRLSQSFDANPGLSRLLLFENLYTITEKAKNGNEEYQKIAQFLKKVKIGEKLGGGSLYTTFAATYTEPDMSPEEIVLKILNPNASMNIQTSHKLALDALDAVRQTGDPNDTRLSDLTQTLVDFSQSWCLADINDPTFEKDDDNFRPTIDHINQSLGEEVFSTPDRLLNTYIIKAEQRAPGRTLNAVLKDPNISSAQKQEAAYAVIELFNEQLSSPPIKEKDVTGKKQEYFLMLSDPNPGNMMVDFTEEGMKCTVIDRNMYLKLTRSQMESLRSLWNGENNAFAREFFFAVCDANKIRGIRQKLSLAQEIKRSIEEKAGSVDLSGTDPVRILQISLQAFEEKGLNIPLDYRLAIKNVFALQTLQERFTLPEEQDITPSDQLLRASDELPLAA